jgi:hypothetical protein
VARTAGEQHLLLLHFFLFGGLVAVFSLPRDQADHANGKVLVLRPPTLERVRRTKRVLKSTGGAFWGVSERQEGHGIIVGAAGRRRRQFHDAGAVAACLLAEGNQHFVGASHSRSERV